MHIIVNKYYLEDANKHRNRLIKAQEELRKCEKITDRIDATQRVNRLKEKYNEATERLHLCIK